MSDAIVDFGKYRGKLTYGEMLIQHPGYCKKAYEKAFNVTKPFYNYLVAHQNEILQSETVLIPSEFLKLVDKKLDSIYFAEIPEEWVTDEFVSDLSAIIGRKIFNVNTSEDHEWLMHVFCHVNEDFISAEVTYGPDPHWIETLKTWYTVKNNTIVPKNTNLPPSAVFYRKWETTGETHPPDRSTLSTNHWTRDQSGLTETNHMWNQIQALVPKVVPYAIVSTAYANPWGSLSSEATILLFGSDSQRESALRILNPQSATRYIIVLDTETSGLPTQTCANVPVHIKEFPKQNYKTSRVLEIAWAVIDLQSGDVVERKCFLLTPPKSLARKNCFDTKLYDECKMKGQSRKSVWTELSSTLSNYTSCTLICHNVAFDRSIVAHELCVDKPNLYQVWVRLPTLCTMQTARPWVHNPPRWPKLVDMYKHLMKKDVVQCHRASADVSMVLDCLPKMAELGWIDKTLFGKLIKNVSVKNILKKKKKVMKK